MPAAVAAAVVGALGVTGVTATLVTIGVQVAVSAVASKAVAALNKPRGASGALTPTQQLSATIRQSAAARRLVYGTVKAGGILVYPAQSSDGEYAYLAIYLGEGPLTSVDPVFWIGDEKSDADKFDDLTMLEFFDGTQTTASATLIAAGGGEWTANDIGHGVGYIVVRYKFDRNAFPNGLVLPAFLLPGRKVFDPRTATTTHTSNPALAGLDYIRSEFGHSAADDEIDWDSFAAAANICDELLDSIDPENVVDGVAGKVRRYTFNGVIETDVGPPQAMAAIEQAMGGFIRNIGGKWRCYAGAWRAPSGPTLTGDFLIEPPVYRAHPGRQQRINIARGTYREPKADWQDVDYREQSIPAKVAAEGEIVQNLSFPATTNGATAQRLAKLAMMQARSRVPLVVKCNYAALLFEELDVINVSLPLIGLSGVYVIDQYTYNADGGITMVMYPHLASDYAWDAETDESLVPEVIKPRFSAPISEPENLQVNGSFVVDVNGGYSFPNLAAAWDADPDALRKHFELQWGEAGSYTSTHIESQTRWATQDVAVGQSYDVRVRSVRLDETTSDWVEVLNTQVQDDSTPPGPPTALSVTGTGTHVVNWTNPNDADFQKAQIYINTTNDPATANLIASVVSLPSEPRGYTHTPSGTSPWFYWVAAADRTGNESARTYAGTAS